MNNISSGDPLPGDQGDRLSKRREFWSRLKRSWVVEWTLTYCTAAFAAFDAVEIAVHAFKWPDEISHFVSVVLLLGIPVAASLAWYRGEQARGRISAAQLLIIALLLLTIGSVWRLIGQPPEQPFALMLSQRDPDIFYGSRKNNYEIARVLNNQAALSEDTQFSEELAGAKTNFFMMSNTAGGIFRSHEPDFEAALKRGVSIRILLSDYSAANDQNINGFAEAVHEEPDLLRSEIKGTIKIIRELSLRANNDKNVYRGNIELRLFDKPIFYTAWVRDGGSPNAIAHMSVHMYRSKNEWPSFRFGKDAQLMVQSLKLDYESLWVLSRPVL